MNQKLLEQILSCPRLPSLPAAAIEVLQLCRRDNVAISEIARTISRDPALTAKILQTVNSGYYGLSHQVSSISHAMVLLGINTVKTLALSFTLVNNLREMGCEGFDPQIIWRRSLISAVGARGVALTLKDVDEEEAFLGGLLQDLGMLALLQALGKPYLKLLKASGPGFAKLRAMERQVLDLDHAIVGERLAAAWKLPDVLLQPIRYHESPDEFAPGAPPPMVIAVALGGLSMPPFLQAEDDEARHVMINAYLTAARRWSPLDETGASNVLQFVGEHAPSLIQHFDLPDGPMMDPQEIVTQAQEILTDLTLRTQLEAQQMKEKATLDSLTGLANRGEFDHQLTDHFEACRTAGRPLALIMLDLDHFKAVNDTHGHQAGDQTLVHVAGLLQSLEVAEGCVARYGGEEFVILLPGLDTAAAQALAEQARGVLEAHPVHRDDAPPIPITASLGLAVDGAETLFESPLKLVAAADRALYAAKQAGRNRVEAAAGADEKAA